MEVQAKGNIFGGMIPARYILAVFGSIGMAIGYGLRVNLSVVMIGMLNHTAILINSNVSENVQTSPGDCPISSNNIEDKSANIDGPFTWSSKIQGVIHSCYFWGYIISQIPGGRISELFSAKWVMFFSVAINVVCTLLTPVLAKLHYVGLILMRIGEGIGGGVSFPAMHVLLSNWAPPAERSVMSSIVYAGTSLGTVISLLMAGGLTATLGWESVFYVMGGMSAIWCVFWIFLVQDTPQKQPLISLEERNMIVTSLGHKYMNGIKQKMSVPWKAVFTSSAFLAILVAHTCSNFGWYMLLTQLPFYMKQVLKFNLAENTLITALPFFILWIFSMSLGRTLDWLRAHNHVTTTMARKIGTLLASVIPALCLLVLCYIGCNRIAAVTLMTIAIVSIGGMFCGFLSNHIDIAPNFAGTLMAITNTIATIPGILGPLFVGYVTHGNQTISAWRKVFFVTIGLYLIEIIVYTIYGSGEQQSWNSYPENPISAKEVKSEAQGI